MNELIPTEQHISARSKTAPLAISESGEPGRLATFAITIFLSAFLLFQVELILSKYLLPWFGGSASVWTTSMLVFQTLLFAGYAYAHAVSTRLLPKVQFRLHLLLIAASVASLVATGAAWPSPIAPGGSWRPLNAEQPVVHVIGLILASVGLPFFVLSSTGPLLQRWVTLESRKSPYRLYAISNLGSLLGLICYPVLIEPNFRLRVQCWWWSALYGVFGAGMVFCAFPLRKLSALPSLQSEDVADETALSQTLSPWARYFFWLCLPGCATIAFLAITNMISQDIAPVPLLWVVPLCIYLVSFIICFGQPKWYKRPVFHGLYLISVLLMLSALLSHATSFELAASALLLFAICMVCHGEMVRLKPPAHHLTAFYLAISAGSALGGIFVGVIAPLLFSDFWEFEISLLGTGLLLTAVLLLDPASWFRSSRQWPVLAMVAAIFLVPYLASLAQPGVADELRALKYYVIATLVALPVVLAVAVFSRGHENGKGLVTPLVGASAVLVLFSYCFIRLAVEPAGVKLGNLGMQKILARSRNFYGVLKVAGSPQVSLLTHGKAIHGFQWQSPAYRDVPTLSYVPNSGVGLAINENPKRAGESAAPMRMGLIGEGVGTLAAYGRPGDSIRFYELDPAVAEMSEGSSPRFTFVTDSQAKVDVVVGDGRMSLEREYSLGRAQRFDLLVLDAFNGDSIPVHLLTREAFAVYLGHLAGAQAVIAIHTPAFTMDLTPVYRGLMKEFHLSASIVHVFDLKSGLGSSWVLMARDPAALNTVGLLRYGRPIVPDEETSVLWTDDFSNPFRLLRVKPLAVRIYEGGRVDVQ